MGDYAVITYQPHGASRLRLLLVGRTHLQDLHVHGRRRLPQVGWRIRSYICAYISEDWALRPEFSSLKTPVTVTKPHSPARNKPERKSLSPRYGHRCNGRGRQQVPPNLGGGWLLAARKEWWSSCCVPLRRPRGVWSSTSCFTILEVRADRTIPYAVRNRGVASAGARSPPYGPEITVRETL